MIIENELVYDKGALDDSRSHLDALVVHLLVELLENTFFPSPRGRARRADGNIALPTAPAGRELSAPPASQ